MFYLNEKLKNKYSILDDYFIQEQNLEVVEIEHTKTKAKVLLFICDDENRVFNIAFKTPVFDNTGTPHILEHSVLCGSRKYDVKDPFVELAKGSMNTFLNAMTFPDKTCYPVASANLKDFENLVDVYLDAVFFPNAVKNDKIFKQEGWHYEIENAEDDLKVNGVVFNEMKGVYSDPDSILESATLKNLYSGSNYEYEYGGKPNDILNLSFNEFKDFHKKYYHPSNSILYLYGKLDYDKYLDYIDNEYFSCFDFCDANAHFLSRNKTESMSEQIDYYSIDSIENKDKAYFAYSFAIDKPKNTLDNILIQILDYILFSSDSAILKDKLLNAGYGDTVFSRYSAGIKQGLYSIVSQNVSEDKKDSFIEFIDNEIKNLVEDGIDIDKLKAGINSIYFDYAEGEFSRTPRGLCFSLSSLDTYLYGDGATTYIEYKNTFDTILKDNLSDKNNLFAKMLKELFIDNDNKAFNVLRPRMGYSSEKEEIIKEELRKLKSNFSKSEIDDIITKTAELKEYQKVKDSEDKLKCIPTISLSDIDRDKNDIDYTLEKNSGVDTIITFKNDKDIVYISLKFDLTSCKKEELYLYYLMSAVLSKLDLKTLTYNELNNYIDINTGGLSIAFDATDYALLFSFRIKTTSDKINFAFEILYKLLSEAIFIDKKRIGIILSENKQNSLLSILSSGHITAINRSKSNFDFRSSILDRFDLNGLSHYRFISEICKNYEQQFELLSESMDLCLRKLIENKMYFTLCTNKTYYNDVLKCFNDFNNKISALKSERKFKQEDENKLQDSILKISKFVDFDSFEKKSKSEAILTPNDINFCALSGEFDSSLYSGSLSVIRTLFNYEYLWTNIRVLGGAYGCMSVFSKMGNYSLCSYRDPHVAETNKVYMGIADFLKTFNRGNSEIHKYIIGSIASYDNPLSTVDNHKRNVAAYFNKISNEEYNKIRHEILDLKSTDINATAKIFDNMSNADKCALISASKADEARKEYDTIWQLME